MERFVIIVTERSILDVAAALDPPLEIILIGFSQFWKNIENTRRKYLPSNPTKKLLKQDHLKSLLYLQKKNTLQSVPR